MKPGIPELALAAAAAAFGVSVAVAQTTAPPASVPAFANPPHKNLKVLPQDISGAELLGTMKFFAQSLGVHCSFCHVGKEGQTPDFASDAKPEKRTAREMMAMVHRINADYADITEGKVTCFTCHRGSTGPLSRPPAETPPAPAPAPAKAERGAA